jgi:hypothetical protein
VTGQRIADRPQAIRIGQRREQIAAVPPRGNNPCSEPITSSPRNRSDPPGDFRSIHVHEARH